MKALNGEGKYEITEGMKGQLGDFYGGYASEKETADTEIPGRDYYIYFFPFRYLPLFQKAGIRIYIIYNLNPKNGVSPIQELQMVTQKGENTYVVGIHGNFDDAQTGVKNIFADKELEERMDRQGYQFSSANSISRK